MLKTGCTLRGCDCDEFFASEFDNDECAVCGHSYWNHAESDNVAVESSDCREEDDDDFDWDLDG